MYKASSVLFAILLLSIGSDLQRKCLEKYRDGYSHCLNNNASSASTPMKSLQYVDFRRIRLRDSYNIDSASAFVEIVKVIFRIKYFII